MAELSKIQNRTPVRDKKVERRSALIDERRNRGDVDYRSTATMRQASRGDVGGAQALLDITRQINKGAADVETYVNEQWEKDQKELSKQGTLDAANETVDEELAERNKSYFRAVELGRAKKEWNAILPTVEGEVMDLVNQQEGTVLTDRLDEIDAKIEAEFQGSILDEEGKLKDYGTSEATLWTANQYTEFRNNLRARAYRAAEEKLDEESYQNSREFLAGHLQSGGVFTAETIEELDGLLTPGVDREAAKRGWFSLIQEYSMTNPAEGKKLLNQILDEEEPLFEADDMVTLGSIEAQVSEQLEREIERERAKRYEENSETIYELFNARTLTDAKLREMEAEDLIPASFATTMLNALEGRRERARIRAEQRSARARAAADRRAAEKAREDALNVADIAVHWRAGRGATDFDGFQATVTRLQERGVVLTPSILSTLDGAWKAGRAARESEPQYVQYADKLADQFDGGDGIAAELGGFGGDGAHAMQLYETYVLKDGMPAAFAYSKALKEAKASPPSRGELTDDDLDARVAEMTRRRGN